MGRARIRISLSGSIQDGTLSADAIQTDGVWGFNSLEVVADDGTQVNVLHF